MRGLALAGLLVLLSPTVALALSCPLYVDQNAAPYGTCTDCIDGLGRPVDNCAVTSTADGTLGCACQSVGSRTRCLDPNVQRCGGVSPWCSSLDLCVLNTAATCVNETGMPTYAPDCYVGGVVNPLVCTCYLVTLKRPLSAEEKTLHQKIATLEGLFSAAAWGVFVAPPSVPVSLLNMWRAIAQVVAAAGVKAQAIANDPPLSSYTTITLPEDVIGTPYQVTTGDGLRPAQVDALNAFSLLASQIQAGEQAAMKSLFRAEGAHEAASIAWYHQQLDAFDAAMSYLQPRYAQQAAGIASFCTSGVWNAKPANSTYPATIDYRPGYQASGMCDPTLGQGLVDLSTANLMSQR